MDFKAKVQAMSAKEILMAVVNGLRAGYVRVDMSTYGGTIFDFGEPICVGCAATAFICEVSQERPKACQLDNESSRMDFLGLHRNDENYIFFLNLERAINSLRQGVFYEYNRFAELYGMAKMSEDLDLPHLGTKTWEKGLEKWERIADNLD